MCAMHPVNITNLFFKTSSRLHKLSLYGAKINGDTTNFFFYTSSYVFRRHLNAAQPRSGKSHGGRFKYSRAPPSSSQPTPTVSRFKTYFIISLVTDKHCTLVN